MSKKDYRIVDLLHIGYTIPSMDDGVYFLTQVMGIEKCRQQFIDHPYIGRVTGVTGCACKLAFIQSSADGRMVELLEYVRPYDNTIVLPPGVTGHAHISYLTNNADSFCGELKSRNAAFISGPQTIDYGAYKGCKAFEVIDSAGNRLQVIEQGGEGAERTLKLGGVCYNVASIDEPVRVLEEFFGFDATTEDTSESQYLSDICAATPSRVASCGFRSGHFIVELWEMAEPGKVDDKIRPSVRGNIHLCFMVEGIEALYRELVQNGISAAVKTPGEVQAGVNKGAKAAYFKLPGNIWVELFEGQKTKT